MMQTWELTDAQRQAAAKRVEVAGWERVLERLDQQYETAAGAEAAHDARCRQVQARMAEIRFGPHPIRLVGQGVRPDVVSGPTDEEMREYRQLEQQLRTAETDRERWLEDRVVRWSDGGLERSYTLTIGSVAWQRDRVRVARDVAAGELASLEEKLSAGELLQAGQPAAEYVEHVQRTEALRQQGP